MADTTLRNENRQAEQQTKLSRLLALMVRFAEPLRVFLGYRAGLALLAIFAGVLFPALPRGGTAPYSPPLLPTWADRLIGIWSHWDGEWYLHLAQSGYQPQEPTSAFFPFYPLLIKILGFILGGNFLLAGVLVSALAALACFILLYELVRLDFGIKSAGRAVLYLAAFPTAFFLSAIYSESLFLALALGAFLSARHYRQWPLAALLVVLATLTRSLGILLIFPLILEWGSQQANFSQGFRIPFLTRGEASLHFSLKTRPNFLAIILFIAAPLMALAGWLLFNQVALGDSLTFLRVQGDRTWNRHAAFPWDTIWRGLNTFLANRGPDGFLPPSFREDPNLVDFPFFLFFSLLFVGACWRSWKKSFPVVYLLYFALGFLLPLLSPTPKQPLLSFPRFGLILFPAFILLALWGEKRPWLHHLYLFGALLLQGLLFCRFSNWYWVA